MTIVPVSLNFNKGYMSDLPRDQLPAGVAHRMTDYVPRILGAALAKRGGWKYATANLNGVSACTSIRAVAWAPFSGDPHLVAIADNGKTFYDRTPNGSGGTLAGTMPTYTSHPLIWHEDLPGLISVPGLGNSVQKYISNGSGGYTVANLGGTPPQARVGASWGDYLLLANGAVGGNPFPNRIWVSGVGTPEVWSTGTAFFDMPADVIRIVPLRSGLFVLGYSDCWLLSGDTPPPGGNWTRQDVFHNVGVQDTRAVALYKEHAIWASTSGVYTSDGFTINDLTEAGGIKQRWLTLLENFNPSAGWSLSLGIYASLLIVSLLDNNGAFVACLVCDLDNNNSWFEFNNVPAVMFAHRSTSAGLSGLSTPEELYFADRSAPYVGAMSSCFFSGTASDADGTAVTPVLETPYWKPNRGHRQVFRRGYLTYDLRDSATPHLEIDYVTSPEDGASYTTVTDELPLTTTQQRLPFRIAARDIGIGLRLRQVNASLDTRVSGIELDVNPLEATR